MTDFKNGDEVILYKICYNFGWNKDMISNVGKCGKVVGDFMFVDKIFWILVSFKSNVYYYPAECLKLAREEKLRRILCLK